MMMDMRKAGRPQHGKFKRWATSGIAGAVLAAGTLAALPLTELTVARADTMPAGTNRVFELRTYHVLPGKMPALVARFRDTTSKLLAQHGPDVVGYWASPEGPDSASLFVFLVAHRSLADAKKNWAAFVADPGFQAVVKAELADKTVDKVDTTYLEPTDYSPLK